MWTLAIDFGTSNTAAAMYADDRAESLEVDGDRRMPSVVLLAEDGNLVVGREAANQASLYPDRVLRAVKRRVGRSRDLLLGDESVPITTAIAALLKPFVAEGLRQRNGEAPAAVVLTHPARWGAERLDILAEAAREAGLGTVTFLPEPVAAAIHYADEHLVDGHTVAVYDLGGGTFDTAVLERHGDSFDVRGMPGGDEFIGGEYFDDKLFKHFGELIAREDAGTWDLIETSDDRQWRDANATLREQCRRAKETLSSNPTAYVRAAERDLHITRDEFEGLIGQDIERTMAELDRTLQIAAVPKEQIGRLYLAGGAGRIPLVHGELTKAYGDRLVTWADPKFVVALGAARYGAAHLPAASPMPSAPPPAPFGAPAPFGGPPATGAPAPFAPPPTGAPAPFAPPPTGQPAPFAPPAPTGAPVPFAPPPPGQPAPYAPPAAAAPAAPSAPAPPPYNPAPAPPAYNPPAPPAYSPPAPPTGPPPAAPGYAAPPAAAVYQPPAAPVPPPANPNAAWSTAPASQAAAPVTPTYSADGKPPGRDKTTIAWICAAAGLLCCLGPAAGLYFANEGKKAGDPQAQTALIVNAIVLVLSGIGSALIALALTSSGGTYY